MNQYEHKHYYYPHQDPFKLGYWEDEPQPSVKEVLIGSLLLVIAFALIGSVLFLN